MAEQLWKGRFSKAVDSRVNDFNSSIRFDQRMIAQDMRGSGVHAAMLAKQGIISEKDCEDILNGLASIADDLASGKLEIDPNAEDVHTFVEQTLTARIGDAGKRLHTGRSRNDQVALDIRLTLRDYSHTLQAYIVELIKVICKKAGENTTAVMPGYTHLQRAPSPSAMRSWPTPPCCCGTCSVLRTPPPAWTPSARWAPAHWPVPPIRWTASSPPRSWALRLPAPTAWMAFLTVISASSWPTPSLSA